MCLFVDEGMVPTLAGSGGSNGFGNSVGGVARFDYPEGVSSIPNGDIFVADTVNQNIRQITTSGKHTHPFDRTYSTCCLFGTITCANIFFLFVSHFCLDNFLLNVRSCENTLFVVCSHFWRVCCFRVGFNVFWRRGK